MFSTILPRTYARSLIKLNLKGCVYAFIIKLLTMQLSGVRLIELCYYNNSVTMRWTSQ